MVCSILHLSGEAVIAAEDDAKAHWSKAQQAEEPVAEISEVERLKSMTPTYIGIGNCKVCHMPHFESWQTTKMSKAFELLKPGIRPEAKKQAGMDPNRNYTTDLECVQCHTTGFGKPGGFTSIADTPDMTDVQCETCHGPGSIYAEMMLKKRGTYTREDYMAIGGMIMPAADMNVCATQCHNQNSPFITSGFEFNFEDRKSSGTHRHDIKYIDMPFDW
ncbi:hypothetical protein MNBD_GAMMA26-2134 [hydrothermal vent metagenome]|uniref:Cytochrome c-552/4 domain-containing protein n=1 Tax=hydrothermal vent metagenome TaxID=652676 RepID=A0A3B1B910_9ZZZZ